MLRSTFGVLAAFSILAFAACARIGPGEGYTATAFAEIVPGKSFTEGKLAAIKTAEKKARDQILVQAMGLKFQSGQTLGDAVITDPFIRAKVYDTIRTAKIADQTVDDNGVVTVTVRLDEAPLLDIVTRYNPGAN